MKPLLGGSLIGFFLDRGLEYGGGLIAFYLDR